MTEQRVCPVEKAGYLDHKFRRWLQNPEKILSPYVQPGMTALDVGCGPGFFSVEMARMVGTAGRVIAVDVQAGMLEKLREKVKGTDLEHRIVLHQCQPDHLDVEVKLDFILAFYVVHEVPHREMFFKEVAALLRSGGKMLLVEPLFHVSRKAFDRAVSTALKTGMVIKDEPKFLLSRSVLLQNDGENPGQIMIRWH
ncbi:MAG: class I SAM-dependent methyltransferase [Thermodesulfobacteriota bacterium]|nr:class I SAM-dependent methyltransferase [Thermodesulfobacteriota bacterium]